MQYIVGDIHGCYREYQSLLKKIHFSDEDELYILGDAMDRGPEPVRVLQDIMNRPNVYYILGNHDIAFYLLMKKLWVEVTDENVETQLNVDLLRQYQGWVSDGGSTTIEQFRKLSRDAQADLLDYLSEADTYQVLEYEDKTYILVHGGLGNFSEDKDMEAYELVELVEERADYTKRYFKDENIYLVTGHTPTTFIEGWAKPEVYRKNGHIALDCGCVGTGVLAAYCVDTQEVIYATK